MSDREYQIDLLPKIEIRIVVRDDDVGEVVETVATAARTGEIGTAKYSYYLWNGL
ncbi:MAG: P-II family nitrogen regulator [Euryarchaeota archaeon]